NISILQSHGYKAGAVAWIVKRLTGLPWVAFVHGYTNENSRMRFYNRLDQWLTTKADCVVAVSQAMGVLLHSRGVKQNRLRVIYNAIDPARHNGGEDGTALRLAWGAAYDDVLIGVIGRLSPEKGQHVFVRAFQRVLVAMPKAKAVL